VADEKREPPWTSDLDSDRALRAATASDAGVLPARSVALYARWWQLETWLRELIYVELRALYGSTWGDAVKVATGRQSQDAAFTHMAGTDSNNPLAYLDYSQLLPVIQAHWDQFEYALIRRPSWEARQEELARIRHRIGHLRRSHPDDLGRLEQMLRDLEHGAFRALASYNDRRTPDRIDPNDRVAVGWLDGQHDDARRLVGHARGQYETLLLLRKSRRPWSRDDLNQPARPGQFWHADFILRGRHVDARQLWLYDYIAEVRPLLVHMLADNPWRVGFTFAAVDDGQAVADAIGTVFEAVLLVSSSGPLSEEQELRWQRRVRDSPDFRLVSNTGWNIVDETTVPISVFGAGASVETAY
jgi:hypothetical protein